MTGRTTTTHARGRFDDLVEGSAHRFDAREHLVARTPAEVPAVLAAVQRATDAGAWAFGYLSYEAAAGLDPRLAVHEPDPDGPPPAWFGIADAPVAVPSLDDGVTAPHTAVWEAAWSPAGHAEQVQRVRERIAAGETYQTNLTTRMRGHVTGEVEGLYRELALAQRGAHNAYLDLGRFAVASASPELFLQLSGDEGRDVLLRPMKGTARRGIDAGEDAERAARLVGSEKERAENVMIVDLMRNDVSRVAEPGSVRVPRLLTVERYGTVLQLTSDVTARLRTGTGLVELFRALFPCGSVTGAPKARTMELIRDLEDDPRGLYCGAIGWVAPPGHGVRARFSVAIRTAVVDRDTGRAVYGTGGGITWSSDPEAEQAEIVAKTAVLRRRHEPFELLETVRHDPGTGIRNRDGHLRRLASSAAHLGFAFDAARIGAALDGSGPGRVRLRLARDGRPHVQVFPLPPAADGPVALALDTEPVDPRDWRLRHKTTLRATYDDARARHPDADDVILVNTRGELTETTVATLALRVGGRWLTPPLASGCLPGVERARLLAAGELHEEVLPVARLAAAEAIAVVSSLRGWRAARLLPAAVPMPTA